MSDETPLDLAAIRARRDPADIDALLAEVERLRAAPRAIVERHIQEEERRLANHAATRQWYRDQRWHPAAPDLAYHLADARLHALAALLDELP